MPQNLSYLVKFLDEKVKSLNAELVEYEKNNDTVYADKTRKEIATFTECLKKFQELENK